jgi:hypothetical protein
MSPRAGLLALAALLAAAPAAHGAAAHQLGLYKVDRHVDVAGEGEVHTIACKPGDIALDGMWRIDDVDQDLDYVADPPPGFGTTGTSAFDRLESVLPHRFEAVSAGRFEVEFLAVGGGDVQGKLFVTCLPDPTPKAGGHAHGWTVGPLVTGPPVAAALPETPATSSGTVAERWPAGAAWAWRFLTDQAGGTVTLSHRCLTATSSLNAGHRHRIKRQFRSRTIAVRRGLSTVEAECGQLYKGVIAAWDLGAFSNYDELWLLGHDPRPKVRAFRMLNADGVARNADFGLVCFKERT